MAGQEIINLLDFLPGESKSDILRASQRGDVGQLKILLEETKDGKPCCNPEDFKIQFEDLLKYDENGRTCLHLAVMNGNHDTALACVETLLETFQLTSPIEKYAEKLKELIDWKDNNKETALHLAIQNKASQVVTYLIEKTAGVSFKSKEGVDALSLIYEKIPEAMIPIYDQSIELTDDFKSLKLDFGPVIGYYQTLKEDATEDGIQPIRSTEFRHSLSMEKWKMETENLSLILKVDGWRGASLLQHPLLKLFLHLKWKKIQAFFYISFFLQVLWLLIYAGAFVDLHSKVGGHENETMSSQSEEEPLLCYSLWYILLPLTILMSFKKLYKMSMSFKELYKMLTFGWTYVLFENLAQILFIGLYFAQFGFLWTKAFDEVASISVVGILLGTLLMICQLGKTPYFGLQVAALIQVLYSCKSHAILFTVFFLGFGSAFWSLFYKSDKFSILKMPAIVTGMATGELNINDLMEKLDAKSTILQIFSVSCIVLFTILIVTVYFNLLIGHAVSDIQLLKAKAELIELSNKLSTISSVEAFLLTRFGRCMMNVFKVDSYVVPRENIEQRNKKEIDVGFEEIPEKILKPLQRIAYDNLLIDE